MMLRKASSDKFSIKKFYKQVSIQKSAHGYSVHLDKRQLKTPNSSPIYLSSEILALSIAFEWHSQKEHIKYFTMPLVIPIKTQLVSISTDLDKLQIRNLFTTRIVSYLETDSIW
jgi:chaperone required for assembly of F1-ATPase